MSRHPTVAGTVSFASTMDSAVRLGLRSGDTRFHLSLHLRVNKHSVLLIVPVLSQSVTHENLAPRQPSRILLLRRSPFHLLNAMDPSIGIEFLLGPNAVRAKEFTPLLLHVKPYLRTLHSTPNRGDKVCFQLRELDRLAIIGNVSNAPRVLPR